MSQTTAYIPYTYLVGWSRENKYYYGVRYSRKSKCLYKTGCHPDDLWVKYFTSSESVQRMREEYGEPDIIEIRKTFDTARDAIDWEDRVIGRLNAIHSSKWLNLNKSGAIYWTDEMILKRGKSMKERCGDDWVNPRIGVTNPKHCKSITIWSDKKGIMKFTSVKEFRKTTGLGSKVSERLRRGEVFNIVASGNSKNAIKVSGKHIFELGDIIRCIKDNDQFEDWIYPQQKPRKPSESLYRPIDIFSSKRGLLRFKSQKELSIITGINQPAIIKLREGETLTIKNNCKNQKNLIRSKYFEEGETIKFIHQIYQINRTGFDH